MQINTLPSLLRFWVDGKQGFDAAGQAHLVPAAGAVLAELTLVKAGGGTHAAKVTAGVGILP
jgi:hypothetical protein